MPIIENPAFQRAKSDLDWIHIAPSASFPPQSGSWNHLVWELLTTTHQRQALVTSGDYLTDSITALDIPICASSTNIASGRVDRLRATIARRVRPTKKRRHVEVVKELADLIGPAPSCNFVVWEKPYLISEVRRCFNDSTIVFSQRSFPTAAAHPVDHYDDADVVVFQTDGQLRQVLTTFGSLTAQARVIPNGVDTERFHPPQEHERGDARTRLGIPDHPKLVAYPSTLKRKKGLATVEELANLAAQTGWFHLVVAQGMGGLSVDERQIAAPVMRRLRSNSSVTLLDGLDQSLMHLLYQATHLTIMPGLCLEGFSMAMLESLACGTPVIAPNIATFDELLEHQVTSLLVPAGSSAADYARLLHELTDEDLSRLGAAARQTVVERYQRPHIVAAYHDTLKEFS